MWLADDDQAALIEQKEKENAEKPEEEVTKKRSKKAVAAAAAAAGRKRKGEMSLDDMYHEGERFFRFPRIKFTEVNMFHRRRTFRRCICQTIWCSNTCEHRRNPRAKERPPRRERSE